MCRNLTAPQAWKASPWLRMWGRTPHIRTQEPSALSQTPDVNVLTITVIIFCVPGYKSTCQLSPILARVFDGRKSLKPIAAREFKPLLIVLGWTWSGSLWGSDASIRLSKWNSERVVACFYENLSDPEKTPAMKSPGRQGMSPATLQKDIIFFITYHCNHLYHPQQSHHPSLQ